MQQIHLLEQLQCRQFKGEVQDQVLRVETRGDRLELYLRDSRVGTLLRNVIYYGEQCFTVDRVDGLVCCWSEEARRTDEEMTLEITDCQLFFCMYGLCEIYAIAFQDAQRLRALYGLPMRVVSRRQQMALLYTVLCRVDVDTAVHIHLPDQDIDLPRAAFYYSLTTLCAIDAINRSLRTVHLAEDFVMTAHRLYFGDFRGAVQELRRHRSVDRLDHGGIAE